MNILALETTDRVASVAVLTDDGCREKRIESPLRHRTRAEPQGSPRQLRGRRPRRARAECVGCSRLVFVLF